MIGNVSQFTLQPMANTNHKFPMMGGQCEIKSTVLANLNSHQLIMKVLCSLSHQESMMSTENDDGEH